jgi:NADH:ubiquinone oxidoreductase subunit 5 (subunit L)/multisubunit Na+/H+ antiporter MnhA subunit
MGKKINQEKLGYLFLVLFIALFCSFVYTMKLIWDTHNLPQAGRASEESQIITWLTITFCIGLVLVLGGQTLVKDDEETL